MNKIQNLILSGAALLLAGVVMLATDSIGVNTAKIIIPILFIISGVFGILFSNANHQVKRASQYFKFMGGAFILFGLIISFGSQGLDSFLRYITYFIMFIGLFDIILGFALVNSDSNMTWGMLIFKTLGGLIGLIGGVAILATSITDQYSGLMITGIVTILMGLGTMVFANKIKTTLV